MPGPTAGRALLGLPLVAAAAAGSPAPPSLRSGDAPLIFTVSLSKYPTLCLDAGDLTAGAAAQIWECNGSPNQVWRFDPGTWRLSPARDTGKCLDAGNDQPGSAVVIWDCNGLPQQSWGFDPQLGTIYLAQSMENAALCLDAFSPAQGGNKLQVWGCNALEQQSWSLLVGVTIRLQQNYHSCMDLSGGQAGDGTPIQLWDCNGYANQQWLFDTSTEQIKFGGDLSKCLDMGSGQAGIQLQLWDCNGLPQQRWGWNGDGTIYSLASQVEDASLCLDAAGGGMTSGTVLQVWGCSGCWNQKWIVGGIVWDSRNPIANASTPGSGARHGALGDCPPLPGPSPSPSPSPTPPPPPPPSPSPSPSPGPAPAAGRCDSPQTPSDSKCSGCPPTKDGKLCASTTRYFDLTKGACGCGNSDPVPKDWWTKTSFTAAWNAKNLDPDSPSTAWCMTKCGVCYRLCTTGGTTQGRGAPAGQCQVFKIENRCGDGFDSHEPYWCSQQLTWRECQQDPDKCKQSGNTNNYGYPAHFDLQDVNGQIDAMGWDNPEVTFEPVSCSEWSGPSWDCQCSADAGPGRWAWNATSDVSKGPEVAFI